MAIKSNLEIELLFVVILNGEVRGKGAKEGDSFMGKNHRKRYSISACSILNCSGVYNLCRKL